MNQKFEIVDKLLAIVDNIVSSEDALMIRMIAERLKARDRFEAQVATSASPRLWPVSEGSVRLAALDHQAIRMATFGSPAQPCGDRAMGSAALLDLYEHVRACGIEAELAQHDGCVCGIAVITDLSKGGRSIFVDYDGIDRESPFNVFVEGTQRRTHTLTGALGAIRNGLDMPPIDRVDEAARIKAAHDDYFKLAAPSLAGSD